MVPGTKIWHQSFRIRAQFGQTSSSRPKIYRMRNEVIDSKLIVETTVNDLSYGKQRWSKRMKNGDLHNINQFSW